MEPQSQMEEETVAEFYLEEFMKHLERLVNMDSGSSDIEGLNRAADYLCSCYQEIGPYRPEAIRQAVYRSADASGAGGSRCSVSGTY